MGTTVSVSVLPPLVPTETLDAFFAQLREVEGRFSTFRVDSEVSRLVRGELAESEEPLAAAIREFQEETGSTIDGAFLPLPPRQQPGGKIVFAWAVEGDLDPGQIHSNTFLLEWPRGSGRRKEFPEVDRAEWFDIPEAKRRILPGQAGLLDDLCERLTPG